VSNCVLEHARELPLVVSELHRVLKPGGQLCLTVMTDKWEEYLWLPKKFWRRQQQHYHLLSIPNWIDLFEQAGFKVLLKKGYLNQSQSRWVEGLHFASLPYLIAKKVSGDWSKVGGFYAHCAPANYLNKVFNVEVSLAVAAAVFLQLQKRS